MKAHQAAKRVSSIRLIFLGIGALLVGFAWFQFPSFANPAAEAARAPTDRTQRKLALSKITLPADAKPTCEVPVPLFNSWFFSGTAKPNGAVKAADGIAFADLPQNCLFFQWSEQMFLWVTSLAPSIYGPGNRIFDTSSFFDVSPPDAMGERTFIPHVRGRIRDLTLRNAQVGPDKLPIVFDNKGQLLEIEPPIFGPNGRRVVLDSAGQEFEIERITVDPNGKPTFFDPKGKSLAVPRPLDLPRRRAELRAGQAAPLRVQEFVVDKKSVFIDALGNVIEVEQGQAGGGQVLQAQNKSLVYFVTSVNDVFAYFLTGAKTGGITPVPTQFPTTQAELDKIIAFAALHGRTFLEPKALAVEIKSSWVEASSLANPNDFITMTATIPVYDQVTDPNLWTPTGKKTTLLAMTAIHVVGSVHGHPELIWATFEHQSNTPNDDYQYINTANATVNVPRSTAGNWLFTANGSTGPFNQAHMSFVSPNIQAKSPFSITPSDTLRRKAFGAGSNQAPNPLVPSAAASNTEVIAINNSVRGKLAAVDVRGNYMMTGSTWTIGGAAPSGRFPSGNEVGTSRSANTTMETYQQGIDNQANGTNCFTCHVTNETDVSHVYPELKPLFP